MTRFRVQGGQFWLDDQPLLIQSGEFHYFRTPADQWRHRLSLLQAAGFNAVATYIPWRWHQLSEGVSDFDGHSHPLRNLAGYLDLAAAMGFWIIARPGPYIMAETLNEGIPSWVFSRYPQAAFISQDGAVQNIASYLHPDFLACVAGWYRAVFAVLTPRQVTRGGRIILVQLDNEMGMLPWVRNIFDVNPDTLARFAAYLVAQYGDRLAGRYLIGNLAETLASGLRDPRPSDAVRIVEDYRRFYRHYLRDYTAWLWAEARVCGLEVPPVINIHGFANGGKTFPIGLSQLAAVMAMEGVISATDVYPLFIGEGNYHQLLLVNEMTKALQSGRQPLFSMEFQAGGNSDFGNGQSSLYDLHSRLCLASGMRAINHYLFCDGENHPLLSPVRRHDWGHPVRKDGTLRRHYARYPRLSRALKAYGSALTLSRPKTVTTIGFLLDYFMTEVNNAFTQEAASRLAHQREVILFDMLARALALTHRPFNAVELSRGDLDVAQTPACWVMLEKQCPAEVQQKLVDYVRRGGKLALVGRMCTEDFDHVDCTVLRDALGITHINASPPAASEYLHVFTFRDVPAAFVEAYSGDFDDVFATQEDGGVVGFMRSLGRGIVMVFGAAVAANTLDDIGIVEQMALRLGCPPLFRLSAWADARLSCGEDGSFLFIHNYQDDPVETTVERENAVMLGGNPVSLPARRGLILPLDWRLNDDVLIHYVTTELVEVADEGTTLTLRTAQPDFVAEMTLRGYICDHAAVLERPAGAQRVRLRGREGVIVLRRAA